MYVDYNQSIEKIIKNVIDENLPLVSNLANVSSVLYNYFKNVSWAGFYLKKENEDVLYLGPFQGGLACTLIPFGKGVCGASAIKKESILVKDVTQFEGHIACSSTSRSEIVVPLLKNGYVYGVIDLDSNELANFTLEDISVLEKVASTLITLF